ncbi:MAG: excinuclease ABC subunit C [Candidatus Solincola sediminis]|nr:MAG: excinuclease ABC subunit C [Candidatus Solincola sediminis]
MNLVEKVNSLPESPGVYLFKDLEGKVLYVGKAGSLRKRVGSYLRPRDLENPRLTQLRSRMVDVDFIVTANEVEALLLEANLIKRHQPPFNVIFRDDKSYPYMMICGDDLYPRVMLTRGQRRRGCIYFGPFAHAGAVRETVETLRKVFPFRACRQKEPGKNGVGPCLDYHIKRCSGPCTGAITPEEYAEIIAGVREFMAGRHDLILRRLEDRMREESLQQEYELAARTRDRLAALNRMLEKQQAHSPKGGDQDVFGVRLSDLDAGVTTISIRGGKILGKQDSFSDLPEQSGEGEILAAFLSQFYSNSSYTPREILLSHPLPEAEGKLLEGWLSDKAGRKVRIAAPRRGTKRRLVERAVENAGHALDLHLAKQASDLGWISRAVSGIYDALNLKTPPYRIECYDISNLGADDAVGSMVVYEGGLPLRRDFRRFRIRGVAAPNDVAMIEQVLSRRLAKLASTPEKRPESEAGSERRLDSFHKKPDLIVIDGGDPQLSAALKAIRESGFGDIEIAALAKKMEELYLPGMRESIYLPRDSEALHLLQRIRDEAHRYALDYHHYRREKRTRRSVLDDIPGIGPKRKKYLLRHYGSVGRIAQASLDELQGLSFIDKRTAENVYKRFKDEERK